MAAIEESIVIKVGAEAAYEPWTHLEQLPRFVEGVYRVDADPDSPDRMHWEFDSGGGVYHNLTVDITERTPGRSLEFRFSGGSQKSLRVTFEPEGGEATKVTMFIEADTEDHLDDIRLRRRVEANLERLKELLEPHDASDRGRRGPSEPPQPN